MSPALRWLKANGALESWLRYRDDPPVLESASPDDSLIEQSLPHAESAAQWRALSQLGIWPVAFDRDGEQTRIAYAIPPSVRL